MPVVRPAPLQPIDVCSWSMRTIGIRTIVQRMTHLDRSLRNFGALQHGQRAAIAIYAGS
jgi:hypothetical protein